MIHFISRWMIMRSGSIVLPPLFYVIAAEKDRLKMFCGPNNSIHTLVVWDTIQFSVESKAITYFHIGPPPNFRLNFCFYLRKYLHTLGCALLHSLVVFCSHFNIVLKPTLILDKYNSPIFLSLMKLRAVVMGFMKAYVSYSFSATKVIQKKRRQIKIGTS